MIRQSSDKISESFQSAGWQAISPKEDTGEIGIVGIYTCDYALIGLVLAKDVDFIKSCWADCQVYLSELRVHPDVGNKRDLYLVFIIPTIDDNSLSDLQRIVNDTYVCRKICIEQGNRTLEESLMDIPFLRLVSRESEMEHEIPTNVEELSMSGLPKELLKDLVGRSKSTILDRLLEGKYIGVHSNED